jgi:hypothetical protein
VLFLSCARISLRPIVTTILSIMVVVLLLFYGESLAIGAGK